MDSGTPLVSRNGVTRTNRRSSRTLTNTLIVPIALTAIPFFAACSDGEEAEPKTVQARIQRDLPPLIHSTMSSASFLDDNEKWAGLMESMSTIGTLSGVGGDEATEPVPAADEEEFDGDSLAEFLIANIFTSDNYEGGGVYAVPSELLCPETDGAADSDCLSQMDQIALKIRVGVATDGLDFDLLVGPDQAAPLSLELRSDRLSTVVDLDATKEAVLHIAMVTGEDAELPDTMDGIFAGSIIRNGPADVSFELAVREDLEIAGSIPGVGPVQLSMGATDPAFSLRLNGADEELTLTYDVGRTMFSIPWEALAGDSSASGTFAIGSRSEGDGLTDAAAGAADEEGLSAQ